MSAAPLPAVRPELCPLCQQDNLCAMEAERRTGISQGPCWCTQVEFSAGLLAQVPDAARRSACICARCAAGARSGHP